MTELDLLQLRRGHVTAAAGCGKTHLIVSTLQNHTCHKPVLVLTHTNAGVAALQSKIRSQSIPHSAYKVMTIDGLAMRLVGHFPSRAGYKLDRTSQTVSYPRLRIAMRTLLTGSHLDSIIMANYSYLIVDEYQDCNQVQNEIIVALSNLISTCILGDPLQGIFGFAGNALVDWQDQVKAQFPETFTLSTPWRWNNVGNPELGEWLLSLRPALSKNEPIDIRQAPKSVRWIQRPKKQEEIRKAYISAAYCGHRNKEENVLVIGDSRVPASRHRLASSVKTLQVVEPVDMKDIGAFLSRLDISSKSLVEEVLLFASTMMTGITPNITLKRISSLAAGKARKPASMLEKAALQLVSSPSVMGVHCLLQTSANEKKCRVYRSTLLKCILQSLLLSSQNDQISPLESFVKIRDRNRLKGRPIHRSAIGSTLLLKGLEADHVVVMDADTLDARNLYVALTRGSRTITIVSNSPILLED